MDIIILRLNYPNDPTHKLVAHQHFLCDCCNDRISLYSVSSVLGKEKRVFDSNNNVREEYELINSSEITVNGFKTPSFIDCTKRYSIKLSNDIIIEKASHRNLTPELRQRIKNRIKKMQEKGKHVTYSISADDLKRWNKILVR